MQRQVPVKSTEKKEKYLKAFWNQVTNVKLNMVTLTLFQ